MKRRFQFFRTLFWREHYEMPQRTHLCLRITSDSKHSHGQGWTVVLMKEAFR